MSRPVKVPKGITANNLIGLLPADTIHNVTGVLSMLRDITLHVPAEESLTLEANSVSGLFDTLTTAINALKFESSRAHQQVGG